MRKIIALGLAMAGMNAITASPMSRREGWDLILPFGPEEGCGISKPKPNKISQAKRRKYARQGRKK